MNHNYTFDGEKPDHISHSQINLGKCLYKYLRLRLLQDIKNESAPMALGKIIHEIIYKYTDELVKQRLQADYELLTTVIENVFRETNYSEEVYKDAREIAIQFGEREIGYDKILAYEQKKKVKIGSDKFGKDIIIELVIDRVNSYREHGTVLELIDYKNQFNILTQADVEKHDQLNMYKYLSCEFLYPNFDWVRIGVHFTRYNFVRWGELKRVKDCSIDFDNMQNYLIRQWERLQNSQEYPPQRGAACFEYNQCPVMEMGECPLWTKKQVDALCVSEIIEDKINAYRKLLLDADTLKAQIRKHFENNANKVIGGKTCGFQKRVTSSYLVKPWYEYCAKLGIDIGKAKISKTEAEKPINKFKKITSMDLDQQKEIHTLQVEIVGTNFKL